MDFVKKPNKRVSLNESQFTILVHGGVVSVEGVDIALQDIGYHRMKQIINTANTGDDLLDLNDYWR